MVGVKEARKELFSYLNVPRGGKEPIGDTVAMAVEFMKYQAEIAYEVGKKQVISITTTASTIGIGWSAFFFGLAQESWLTSSLGLMLAFSGTFILGYWTPKILDGARRGLEEIGASKFYQKWLADSAGAAPAEKGQ